MMQGSPEWFVARAGHATASRFSDVLAKIKTGEAASRINYRWQLVTERLTQTAVEGYTNAAMQWGIDHESEARAAYEAHTGELVQQTDFHKHPDFEWVGASPDGLVGEEGGMEIKCPHNSVIHVQTIHGGMPSEHRAQIQGAMWVTDRAWWDFVSFDPRMPERLQLYVERVKRDEGYINTLTGEVIRFLDEVEGQHRSLLALAEAA